MISYTIMNHPARRADAIRLQRQLAPTPSTVITDHLEQGCRITSRTCILAGLRTGADHIMVLSDDVLLCRDFTATMDRIVELLPEEVICPFVNRKAALAARDRGIRWLITGGPWGQGVLLPAGLAREAVAWMDRHIRPDCPHDDIPITLYLHATGRQCWCPIPSLVEHIGWDRSVCGNPSAPGGRKRVATWFIGADRSGLSIDWTRGILMPVCAVKSLGPRSRFLRDPDEVQTWPAMKR